MSLGFQSQANDSLKQRKAWARRLDQQEYSIEFRKVRGRGARGVIQYQLGLDSWSVGSLDEYLKWEISGTVPSLGKNDIHR